MTDVHVLELIATGTSLAADFLKLRLERGESCDSIAFQNWLKNEAFPQLLEQSDQTLRSLISLKASQHERYNELLDHVVAIRRAVVEPTAADEWSRFGDVDRGLLMHVYEKVRDDPLQHVDVEELETALQANEDVLVRSARYLSERCLVKLAEWSGSWSIAPQSAGVCLAWAAVHAQEYAAAIARVVEALPPPGDATRLCTLVADADVPAGLAYFLVCEWARQDRLSFEDDASPYDGALIHNVREVFLRSIRSAPG